MKVNNYMAILRNLRNILEANVSPEHLEKVWRAIEDPEAVKRSKQLPFRFLSAYKQIMGEAGSRALDALESAVEASVENMPKLPGTTVIAVDTSGSMGAPVSAKSNVACVEIGMMLGLIANRICENSHFFTFDMILQKPAVSRRSNILETCAKNARAGGGTNMGLPFEAMIRGKIAADRVIIISDNECNSGWSMWNNRTVQSLADEYRRSTGNNIWVHAIDLMGYGTQQFHGDRTNIIAGWSDRVLDFIRLAEQGEGTLEKTIADYKW